MKKSALNFRKMRESDDLIDESVVLWDRLDKDGYLLFRQVLDASAVHRMRGQFLDRLYGTGVVDPDSQDLTYNGADLSVFPVFGGIADVLENYKRDPAERPRAMPRYDRSRRGRRTPPSCPRRRKAGSGGSV